MTKKSVTMKNWGWAAPEFPAGAAFFIYFLGVYNLDKYIK